MTGDERLAKVAEVLAGHVLFWNRRVYPAIECSCEWHGALGDDGSETDGLNDNPDAHRAHVAQALAPLLDEFRAEDEARGLREVRAVHERYFDLDGTPGYDDTTPEPEDVWRYDRDFRAALAAAEPDVGER